MLIGFGGYGTDPQLPAIPGAQAEAVKLLGAAQPAGTVEVCSGDWCLSRVDHLDTEKRNRMLMGAAGGLAAGLIVGYLVTR